MKIQTLKVDGLKLWMTVVVLMTAVAVLADDSRNVGEAGRGHGPCREDAEKLCAGIKPGDGAIRKCLREHKDQLSDACKEKIKKIREKRKERREKHPKEQAEQP